jgi:hypothetical protein
VDLGNIFDDFYDNKLRNAIAHSDYILTDEDFRCRGGLSGIKAFKIGYEQLDKKLLAAKAFIAAFFQIELLARQVWGLRKSQAIPYDPHYKGLMEILVDDHDVMCGFAPCRETEHSLPAPASTGGRAVSWNSRPEGDFATTPIAHRTQIGCRIINERVSRDRL